MADKAYGTILLDVGTLSITTSAGATATTIGFTRGGEFNDNYKTRDIQVDGRYRDWETDRKSTRLNSSHRSLSRMPSSA